jgi:hypothetical protein
VERFLKTTSWRVVFFNGLAVENSQEGDACAAHEDSREDNEREAACDDNGSLFKHRVNSADKTESNGSSDDTSICNEEQVSKVEASLETAADKSKLK